MKNSKGITMASLIVIIASIILLATMAISFGYRYLIETKKADEKYFKEVLSNAVIKRENNYNLNMPEYPRVGYPISEQESFKEIINKYLPKLKDDSDILFERGLWYILDARAAEKLGVKGASDYVDVYDNSKSDGIKVALVDYYTGTILIVEIKDLNDLRN